VIGDSNTTVFLKKYYTPFASIGAFKTFYIPREINSNTIVVLK